MALACVAGLALAGCASLAEYRDEPPKTAEIVRNIRCELIEVIQSDKRYDWLLTEKGKGWTVKLSFDFLVDQNGEISTGDNTWVFPMNQGATFLLTLGGGVTGTGNRRENIEFDHALKDLVPEPQPQNLGCYGPRGGRLAQLGGNIGIADLIERATLAKGLSANDASLSMKDHASLSKTTDDTSLSKMTYFVEFIVKKTANLSPKFNLIPIGKEKTFTSVPRWNGTRTDTQRLTITFNAPEKEKEAEVCPVMSDALAGWPNLAEPRRKCPMPVYEVAVRPSCRILQLDTQCKQREKDGDCALLPVKDHPEELKCEFACRLLNKKECDAREGDCKWNDAEDRKQCEAKPSSQKKPQFRFLSVDDNKPRRLFVPRPATTSSGGLSQSDKDALDRAAARGLLESIDAQLTRQRPGN